MKRIICFLMMTQIVFANNTNGSNMCSLTPLQVSEEYRKAVENIRAFEWLTLHIDEHKDSADCLFIHKYLRHKIGGLAHYHRPQDVKLFAEELQQVKIRQDQLLAGVGQWEQGQYLEEYKNFLTYKYDIQRQQIARRLDYYAELSKRLKDLQKTWNGIVAQDKNDKHWMVYGDKQYHKGERCRGQKGLFDPGTMATGALLLGPLGAGATLATDLDKLKNRWGFSLKVKDKKDHNDKIFKTDQTMSRPDAIATYVNSVKPENMNFDQFKDFKKYRLIDPLLPFSGTSKDVKDFGITEPFEGGVSSKHRRTLNGKSESKGLVGVYKELFNNRVFSYSKAWYSETLKYPDPELGLINNCNHKERGVSFYKCSPEKHKETYKRIESIAFAQMLLYGAAHDDGNRDGAKKAHEKLLKNSDQTVRKHLIDKMVADVQKIIDHENQVLATIPQDAQHLAECLQQLDNGGGIGSGAIGSGLYGMGAEDLDNQTQQGLNAQTERGMQGKNFGKTGSLGAGSQLGSQVANNDGSLLGQNLAGGSLAGGSQGKMAIRAFQKKDGSLPSPDNSTRDGLIQKNKLDKETATASAGTGSPGGAGSSQISPFGDTAGTSDLSGSAEDSHNSLKSESRNIASQGKIDDDNDERSHSAMDMDFGLGTLSKQETANMLNSLDEDQFVVTKNDSIFDIVTKSYMRVGISRLLNKKVSFPQQREPQSSLKNDLLKDLDGI